MKHSLFFKHCSISRFPKGYLKKIKSQPNVFKCEGKSGLTRQPSIYSGLNLKGDEEEGFYYEGHCKYKWKSKESMTNYNVANLIFENKRLINGCAHLNIKRNNSTYKVKLISKIEDDCARNIVVEIYQKLRNTPSASQASITGKQWEMKQNHQLKRTYSIEHIRSNFDTIAELILDNYLAKNENNTNLTQHDSSFSQFFWNILNFK